MIPATLRTAAAVTVLAAAILAPWWFWGGGILELEALQFIQQYLDGRSLPAKIFDPSKNDFGFYQGRELSYFIDYVDARVFEWLMRRGWIVFVPLSAVLASTASAGIVIRSLRRYGVGLGLSTLLALLFLTNYVHIVTMGMFYRATKPVVATLLLAMVFYVAARLAELSDDRAGVTDRRRLTGSLVLFALLLPMGLLDRQGHFYVLTAAAILGAWTLVNRRVWMMAAAGVAAAALVTAYDWWIGPYLVHAINGYTPSLDYQQIPRERWLDVTPFLKAVTMLGENSTILLGSRSMLLAGAVGAATLVLGVRRAASARWRLAALAIVAGVFASQIAMFGFMIARHPMVYDWVDHRYWYYPLPYQAVLFAGLCLLLARASTAWSSARRAVAAAVILLLIAGNISQWTEYRTVMMNSRWFYRVYPQTTILRESLEKNDADPRLIVQYYGFYEFCQKLRGGSQR